MSRHVLAWLSNEQLDALAPINEIDDRDVLALPASPAGSGQLLSAPSNASESTMGSACATSASEESASGLCVCSDPTRVEQTLQIAADHRFQVRLSEPFEFLADPVPDLAIVLPVSEESPRLLIVKRDARCLDGQRRVGGTLALAE